MRLRACDLFTAKHLGSDGECPAPTAENPVKARLSVSFHRGRGAGKHGLAPGLANAARASASPASGARGRDGAGDQRARLHQVNTTTLGRIRRFNASMWVSEAEESEFVALVLAKWLAGSQGSGRADDQLPLFPHR